MKKIGYTVKADIDDGTMCKELILLGEIVKNVFIILQRIFATYSWTTQIHIDVLYKTEEITPETNAVNV